MWLPCNIFPQNHSHFRHLTNSLLKQIDPKKATADELREAFCRSLIVFLKKTSRSVKTMKSTKVIKSSKHNLLGFSKVQPNKCASKEKDLPKDVQAYFDLAGMLMLTVLSFNLLHRWLLTFIISCIQCICCSPKRWVCHLRTSRKHRPPTESTTNDRIKATVRKSHKGSVLWPMTGNDSTSRIILNLIGRTLREFRIFQIFYTDFVLPFPYQYSCSIDPLHSVQTAMVAVGSWWFQKDRYSFASIAATSDTGIFKNTLSSRVTF